VAENMPPSRTFVLLAALALLIAPLERRKPRAVFSHAYDERLARGADFAGDLR
jgi:hypothetical protein